MTKTRKRSPATAKEEPENPPRLKSIRPLAVALFIADLLGTIADLQKRVAELEARKGKGPA